MTFKEKMLFQGNLLFKYRGEFPVIFLPFSLWLYISCKFEYLFVWEYLCFSIGLFGYFIRCYTVGFVPFGTSGRNTKKQIANALNTKGIYSIVRNPLYVGNFFMWLAVALLSLNIWFIILFIFLFILFYERIIFVEETFLEKKYNLEFLRWARETPMFFPSFKNYEKSEIPFSIKNVLKREYSGLFALILVFTLFKIFRSFYVYHKIEIEPIWSFVFIFGFLYYLILRTLKRKTKILKVKGR